MRLPRRHFVGGLPLLLANAASGATEDVVLIYAAITFDPLSIAF
jgi:hypothetical protein